MKKLMFLLVITFVMITNVGLKAAPDCDNFPCNPVTPWTENAGGVFADPFCPDCEYGIIYDYRLIYCNGQYELQFSIDQIYANPACYNCYSMEEIFNNAMNVLIIELMEQNYFPNLDIKIYRVMYQPCWTMYYSQQFGTFFLIPCDVDVCCITIFDAERDENGNPILSNPVTIEPTFAECNTYPNPNGNCYPMCGVFDPWGKKTIFNGLLHITKPEISPNPAKDYIDVHTSISEKGLVTLNVYDQMGNLLIESVKYSEEDFKFTINTSNLSNGSYYINLLINGKVISTGDQFIINR
jgi:hypothetical protein